MESWPFPQRFTRRVISIVSLSSVLLGAPSATRAQVPFVAGDVFVGGGASTVTQYSAQGVAKATLQVSTASNFPQDEVAGLCFDAGNNLYATTFNSGMVTKFDSSGQVLVSDWGGPRVPGELLEGCAVSPTGEVYVGRLSSSGGDVRKFDPAGNLLQTYTPVIDQSGVGYLDFGCDPCVLFYTSRGGTIRRFDVCQGTQLPDFATGLTRAFGIHVRPSGEALVVEDDPFSALPLTHSVRRFDAAGTLVQTYPGPSYFSGHVKICAVDLDLDGTSFWTGPRLTNRIAKIDIASGNVLQYVNVTNASSIAVLRPHFCTDHFKCYRVQQRKDSPPFTPVALSFVDQFGSTVANVVRPLSLCTPVSKRDEDPQAPSHPDHLIGYATTPLGPVGFTHVRNLRIVNQFGTLFLDAIKRERLLVPTAKSLVGFPSPPAAPAVDHFRCYKVRRSQGTPPFVAVKGVKLADQFGTRFVNLHRPSRLCAPVNKNGESPGAEKHPEHLLCYPITPAKGELKFSRLGPIYVNNQFGPALYNGVKQDELCVPSIKSRPQLCGDSGAPQCDGTCPPGEACEPAPRSCSTTPTPCVVDGNCPPGETCVAAAAPCYCQTPSP